jgi:hypothetical protein
MSPVIPVEISVYDWLHRPIARYNRPYIDNTKFQIFWKEFGVKGYGIFVEKDKDGFEP